MKIYCSGIGGIGLSSYASLQKVAGHDVYGSDKADSALLDDLRTQGIEITLNQDGSQIPDDINLFVYSEAIPKDAPERKKAQELGIKQLTYFAALGELSKDSYVIAVTGTHGKSSTVAMTARMLIEAGKEPTVQAGTKLKELDGRNWRVGSSDVFVLEACEYRESFLYLHPDIILLTNADGDHFDAYASVEDYHNSIRKFLDRLPENGIVITHLGDPDCALVTEGLTQTVIDADSFPKIQMKTPGDKMRENAQLVLALASYLQIDLSDAEKYLNDFDGSWRRIEYKGEIRDTITVIDDYAHHPREITATLDAIREKYGQRRLVLVYQPHMHNRTITLYDQFLPVFKKADLVIIPNIYDARHDTENDEVDVDTFLSDISEASSVQTLNGESLENTKEILLQQVLQQNDIVVFMGAGDVTDLATDVLKSA